MKNIHVLPTDNPSRLLKTIPKGNLILSKLITSGSHWENQNIYVTSDEEIKEGDYFWKPDCNMIFKAEYTPHKGCQKVILTTDQDLIKDGVQAIDDEFLEWFVKNPSCEEVEVGYGWIRLTETDNEGYWVSIPDKQFEMQQEEPKQEKMYSEEEVLELLQKALTHKDNRETGSLVTAQGEIRTANFYSWFEQNKKK
jgi:hypothetical protein